MSDPSTLGEALLATPRPWCRHGRLRVSRCGHQLVYEDGAPFFWLGCTPWMLVQLDPDDLQLYLDDRATKGFNVVQIVISNWLRGDYLGRMPFLGEGGRPYKAVAPHEAYWAHVDYVIDQVAARGMHAALVTSWGRGLYLSERTYFTDPEQHNYAWGRWLGRRYAHCDHVIWVAAGEYGLPEARDPDWLRHLTRMAEGLRVGSGGGQLITFHPHSGRSSSEDWHNSPWVDLHMIQTFGKIPAIVELMRHDYALPSPKPVLNAEPAYEGRHHFRPDLGLIDDAHMRLEGYLSVFAGGCGYTYGHMTLYHFGSKPEEGVDWRAALSAPGAAQMRHLRALMESKPLNERMPDSELVMAYEGAEAGPLSIALGVRAVDGAWAMVYSAYGYPFTVNLARLQGLEMSARWFDPRTGMYSAPWKIADRGAARFTPPGLPGRGNDWVLVIDHPACDA